MTSHSPLHPLSRLPRGLFSILCLGAILWLTLSPHPLGDNDIELFPGADKLCHAIMFGGFAWTLLFDRQRKRDWQIPSLKRILLTFIQASLLGLLIEYLQEGLNLGRTFEWSDFIADSSGALIFSISYLLPARLLKQKDSTPPPPTPPNSPNSPTTPNSPNSPRKRRSPVGIAFRALGTLLLVVLLLPILLYVPPIQTAIKNLACHIVENSTGMRINVDRLSLKFPLDIQLDNVTVVPAPGDTMVSAANLVADLKLLPLLKLDIDINSLSLSQAKLNILSADSSMNMRIRAGVLTVGRGSSFSVKDGDLDLRDALLRDGRIDLTMDVWKKEQTPTDTTATPFTIRANSLKMENFTFGMAMLPTIDTLNFQTAELSLLNAVIDLKQNKISASNLVASRGNFQYLTPTAEYIATHPAPIDTVSAPSAPMEIRADSISLTDFGVLYATVGAKPTAGFDPSYISLSGLDVKLHNFFNAATTITAPVSQLRGRERSGLEITSGSGVFSMDSTGMALKDLKIATPFSHLALTAQIPNALLELKPEATLDVTADASIGMADINAFMPSFKQYTSAIGLSTPLRFAAVARGSLTNADIPKLDIALPGILSLRASGRAANPTDFKNLIGSLNINGELKSPQVAEKITGPLGFELPTLTLKGTASANRQIYGADLTATTSAGNMAAKGKLSLTAERYDLDLTIDGLDPEKFVKEIGISYLTGRLQAVGSGFNPEKASASTDIHLDIADIVYNSASLRDIHADLTLNNGDIGLNLVSPNKELNLQVEGHGTIRPDLYNFDINADITRANLKALGLSETPNEGSGRFSVKGTASPKSWNYDVDLDLQALDWELDAARYTLPAMTAKFFADGSRTFCHIASTGLNADFNSPMGLKPLVDAFTQATANIDEQIKSRAVDIEGLEQRLPSFSLQADASGSGIMADLLGPSGMAADTLSLRLSKDSLINGNLSILNFNTTSLSLDTISLQLSQREQLLDYALHIGNGPGEMEEFADVNLNGYLGNNRLSSFLTQHNIKGQQGYRFGLTAALADSVMTVHFTPLKATIAYLPWKINLDNHVDYCLTDHHISANILASSSTSSILLKTEPISDGVGEELHLNLKDIRVQDFLNMSITAPPLTATLNSDLRLYYTGHSLEGKGNMAVSDLTYNRMKLQDLNLNLNAGLDPVGDSRIDADLLVAQQRALSAALLLGRDSLAGLQPKTLDISFDGLPLSLANPFVGADVASLSGKLFGKCNVDMTKAQSLRLNGDINFDEAGIFLPIMGTTLHLDSDPLTVSDNVVVFDNFNILAANANPLTLNGNIDASKLTDIHFNMLAAANNFQLVGNTNKRSDLSGKLFLNLDARAKGSLSVMDINANVTVLPTTDVVYNVTTASALDATSAEGVVKFTNLADSLNVAKADSLLAPTTAMRITAGLTLQQGMQVTVNLPQASGTSGKIEVSPSGNLSYFQNYMGDMKLNGQLLTGEGFVKYALSVVGTKNFSFEPSSSITWNGDLMNPTLNIHATDPVKANVQLNGQASLVDFNVILGITGTLSSPKVLFDLTTDNDMSIQNELQSMTAEQRSTAAMSMLVTGQYTGAGAKTVNSNFVTGNLYNILTSQLNALAARAIKGVDLSFGVNQYETGDVGASETATSYSYQMSKSLFNNRFKIVVGGNYSTDANADENFAQNLISDISFDYTLLQRTNYSLLARLFRHTGYESVLEGEITETGVALAYRRRLNNLKSLFRLRRRNRSKASAGPDTTDSVAIRKDSDSVMVLKPYKSSDK